MICRILFLGNDITNIGLIIILLLPECWAKLQLPSEPIIFKQQQTKGTVIATITLDEEQAGSILRLEGCSDCLELQPLKPDGSADIVIKSSFSWTSCKASLTGPARNDEPQLRSCSANFTLFNASSAMINWKGTKIFANPEPRLTFKDGNVIQIDENTMYQSIMVRGINVQEMQLESISDPLLRTFGSLMLCEYFNASNLNASVWSVMDRACSDDPYQGIQAHSPEDVFIENGTLHLRAQKRQTDDICKYTSGGIETRSEIGLLYGEIVWRTMIPETNGFWTDFGLQEIECQQELCPDKRNLAFIINGEETIRNQAYIYSWNEKLQQNGLIYTNFKIYQQSTTFHEYKIIWLPNRISWFLNSIEFLTVTDPLLIPRSSMKVFMRVAVRERNNDSYSYSDFPVDVKFDSVVFRPSKYRIFFEDYFNNNNIDTSVWIPFNFANTAASFFRPDDVFIRNGHLILQAQRRNYGDYNTGLNRNYTSGGVFSSAEDFSFLYGEVTWRARVAKGRGLETQFSLSQNKCIVPNNSSFKSTTQFVIWGNQTREARAATTWWEEKTNTSKSIISQPEFLQLSFDLSSNFYTYKIIWSPSKLSWYIGGKEIMNITDPQQIPSCSMQVGMAIIVHAHLESYMDSPTDSSTLLPAETSIDYVQVITVPDMSPTNDSEPEHNLAQTSVWIYATASLAGSLGILVLIGIIFHRYRLRKKRQELLASVMRQQDSSFPLSSRQSSHIISNPKTLPRTRTEVDPCFQFLEISVERLERTEEYLGKGQFGSVWKGRLKGSGLHNSPSYEVAIKTVCSDINSSNKLHQNLLIEEMKIMIKVGRHLNIVNLLGTITQEDPVSLILEFCSEGDLLTYLQSHRSDFDSYVDNDELYTENQKGAAGSAACYIDVVTVPSTDDGSFLKDKTKKPLSTDGLVSISYQIARGLEFLAARSIVHRDLAARNILVCKDNIVKISDFGLAKERSLSNYVEHEGQIPLPIKWMAPESILKLSFTHKSDVWSFGVLLWEIFSLGETPYTTGLRTKGGFIEFAHALCNGERLSRPFYAPTAIYEIMSQCWNIEKNLRPSPSSLREQLSRYMEQESLNYYTLLDGSFEPYNVISTSLPAVPQEEDCLM